MIAPVRYVLAFAAFLCGPAAGNEARFPAQIDAGAWPTAHVQGAAIDFEHGHVYFSFTTRIVKTDFAGKVLGTLGGFSGHLGDLDFHAADGRIYGSLEYKAQQAFYIAIIDGRKIDRPDMQAQGSGIFRTVHLATVADDYAADMDGDGKFDGNTADTPDHRYGCSGIDGVSFGPRFGESRGRDLLTVAYGIYSNPQRDDNDRQVLLQYDASDWWDTLARPLVEAAPHRSGPAAPMGKFFLHTGNTTYGVQNLEFDEAGGRWLLGVYPGKKPAFPNFTLFAVDASTQPQPLPGGGASLTLAAAGRTHAASGIRGWMDRADVGMISLGSGRFYLAVAGKKDGKQTATLHLHRWVGGQTAFEKIDPP